MEENNKKSMVSLSRSGFWWYTFFSFLLVSLLIFIAVMTTYNKTVDKIGSVYAEQLALTENGVEKTEVTKLQTKQSYYNGINVFKVSYEKDGKEHVVYINAENATITAKTTGEPEVRTPNGTVGNGTCPNGKDSCPNDNGTCPNGKGADDNHSCPNGNGNCPERTPRFDPMPKMP